MPPTAAVADAPPLSAGAGAYSRATHPRLVVVASVGCVALLLLLAIVLRNDGHFAYTLDAAYTHLALSEQIAQGHYGINPDEPASPSSSILYPFLLAALAPLPLGQFAPLLICLMATVAAALLGYGVIREAGIEIERLSDAQLALLTIAVTLAFNLVGLAFAGLEHSLHVTFTLASLLGLLRFIRRGEADWWWLASIALMPLLRFEAVAALAADMFVLIAFGKWRHALVVGLVGASGVAAFMFFLHWLGLPWLPSSVLSRSEVASTGVGMGSNGLLALPHAVYRTLRSNLVAYGGTLITLMMLVSAWGLARDMGQPNPPGRGRGQGQGQGWGRAAAVGFFVVIALAQLLGGSLGSFSRYEIYVLALGGCAIVVAWQPEVNAALRKADWPGCLATSFALVFLFSGYLFRTLDATAGSGNVYDQQYQLSRFVTGYWQQPYATNHPGRVNWRNPHYMLDYSGLASEEARRNLADPTGAPVDWVEQLARRHEIALAMLYDVAGPAAPASWSPVARLRLRGRVITAVGSTITFYATQPESIPDIMSALQRFAPSLPRGAEFDLQWAAQGHLHDAAVRHQAPQPGMSGVL
ncbi:MAG: hypothetical protein JWP04_3832 [Belnapia sp.]|nr:hypothetical protein [Belnapia sp.]